MLVERSVLPVNLIARHWSFDWHLIMWTTALYDQLIKSSGQIIVFNPEKKLTFLNAGSPRRLLVCYRSCVELGSSWAIFYSRNIASVCINKLKLKYLPTREQQWLTFHMFKAQKLHECSHWLRVGTLGCHDWYLKGYRYPLMFVFLYTLGWLCTVWYTLTVNALFHAWPAGPNKLRGADPGATEALSSGSTINVCMLRNLQGVQWDTDSGSMKYITYNVICHLRQK